MSDRPRYSVEILERLPDGRNAWTGLLTTSDKAEADALYESLLADEGVKARIETLPAVKR